MIELVRPPSQQFREDIVKSPSMQSVAESIVSVIERQPGSRTSSRPGSRPESALGMRPVFPNQVSGYMKYAFVSIKSNNFAPQVSPSIRAEIPAQVPEAIMGPPLERKTFSQPALSSMIKRQEFTSVYQQDQVEDQLQQQKQFSSEKAIPTAVAASSRFELMVQQFYVLQV